MGRIIYRAAGGLITKSGRGFSSGLRKRRSGATGRLILRGAIMTLKQRTDQPAVRLALLHAGLMAVAVVLGAWGAFAVHGGLGWARGARAVIAGVLVVLLSSAAMYAIIRRRSIMLTQREARLRALIGADARFVWAANAIGNLQKPAAELLPSGAAAEDADYFCDWLSYLHPDDHTRCISAWDAAVRAGAELSLECRLHEPDNGYRHYRLRGLPQRDAYGNVEGWIGTGVDIEAQRRLQQRAEARVAELGGVLDSAPLLLARIDANGRIVFVNRGGLASPAFNTEALLNKPLASCALFDHAEVTSDQVADAIERAAAGVEQRCDVLARRPDGRIDWVELTLLPLPAAAGKNAELLAMAVDIGARKQMELELRQHDEALSTTLNRAGVGYWDWDLRSRRLRLSPQRQEQLGFGSEDIGVMDVSTGLIHPDDQQRVLLAPLPVEGGTLELRLRHKDGRYRSVSSRAAAVRDTAGRVVRLVGFHSDAAGARAAARIAVRARRNAALAALATDALGETGTDKLVRRAEALAAEVLGAERVHIVPGGARAPTGAGAPSNAVDRLAAAVAAENRELVAAGSGDAVTQQSGTAAAAAAGVPLRDRDRCLGAIVASWAAPRPLQDELEFLRNLATVVVRALRWAELRARLQRSAHYDRATGLPMRSMLVARLEQELAAAGRAHALLALLHLRIDHLRVFQEPLDHAAAEALLVAAAERVRVCLRPDDLLFRGEGDEFLVVLPQVPHVEWISGVARTVLSVFAESFDIEGREVQVSASAGVSVFEDSEEDARGLLQQAQIALDQARRRGDGSFAFYSPDMEEKLQRRSAIKAGLQKAALHREFRVAYQPQIDLANGRMIGVEALLRWDNPALGEVPPSEFIPVAEEAGLIEPLGRLVLKNVCTQVCEWRAAGVPAANLRVSVNLSARQLRHPDLVRRMLDVVRDAQLEPRMITVEISEADLVHSLDAAERAIEALRSKGFRIAIDDFGTGGSNLHQLRRFGIDVLKIDNSLVHNLATDGTNAAATQSIIALAHGLGADAVAEGLETQAELEFLRREGCDAVQGYYFAPPVSADDIAGLLIGSRRFANPSVALRGSAPPRSA
jgi:diguanylate cyclase (GGDEF)-like protein/PAS domain S-box-containing protein